MQYLDDNWYGLNWTTWISFLDRSSFQAFPTLPGVYRVKPVGSDELFYIGQTGRTLRERLRSLIRNTLQDSMPFNDPHTAAPSLWAWRDAAGITFEASATPTGLPGRQREGLESCLLWLYRLTKGESTACNHGRFHPHYHKSRNRGSGQRGGRLPPGQTNSAGGVSLRPLQLAGEPTSNNWMGLNWQELCKMTPRNVNTLLERKGIYRIIGDNLLYIGQTTNLKNRLSAHLNKHWGFSQIYFTYYDMPDEALPHQLKEWENDMLGAYYYQTGDLPLFQLAGK